MNEDDYKNLSEVEQATTKLEHVAKVVGSYFVDLQRQGFTRAEAMQLIDQFHAGYWESQFFGQDEDE